ncbi:uncharacterized protein [Gossypium hirsutum]|uniref:Gag-Pol polyprotein n=1 Tax=Gossypium hirsutum TaxID=3635 RepID=A0ABM3A8D8_GOSHI|nr:uncharacterized protein LOC121218261 [Gossypium hirsutum]
MGKSHQSSSKRSKESATGLNASVGFSNRNKNRQNTTSRAQTTPVTSIGSARPNRPECLQCCRHHFSKCCGNERGCFKCESLEHFIHYCPEMEEREKKQEVKASSAPLRSRPQRNPRSEVTSRGASRDAVVRSKCRALARSYAIRACEEAKSHAMITGTFSIHDISVVSLTGLRKVIEWKGEDEIVLRVGPDESDTLPVIISSLIAEKYLRKGYEADLALLLNT